MEGRQGDGDGLLDELEKRLVLMYTGKPRLAKNLLQNVVRNWYSKDKNIVECFNNNYSLAGDCWDCVKKRDVKGVGRCLSQYWVYKRRLAPGSEPVVVRDILAVLEKMTDGASLAGAGGGGFLAAVMMEGVEREEVERAVRGVEGTDRVTFHTIGVDREGIRVTVGGEVVPIPL